MKRCPECRRDYYDETLLYCLDDGTRLIDGSGQANESPTIRIPDGASASEAPTRLLEPINGAVENSPDAGARSLSRRNLLIIAVLSAVFVIGIAFGIGKYRSSSGAAISSIAVMPFKNESGDANADFLSDGMTETLINTLSQLPSVSVKARSIVFNYRDSQTDVTTLGKELNVQAVLNGRVVERGDNLTLYLELADARTGNRIWGEQYNRKISDLVALQTEIARDVTSKLRAKLAGDDGDGVAKKYSTNSEAYQLYLKGRFYWNKRNLKAMEQAKDYFRQAIEKDPNYALAYAGLADCYVVNAGTLQMGLPGKDAALRALTIDPTLAEPHASLAMFKTIFEHDWDGAKAEYEEAIRLDPKYATAHQWFGIYWSVLGRSDYALAEIDKALDLDPLSLIINTDKGRILYYARRNDEAIVQLEATLKLDPDFAAARNVLGWCYLRAERYDDAIAQFRRLLDLGSFVAHSRSRIAVANARAGRLAEAKNDLRELEEYSKGSFVAPNTIALVYAALGEKEKALDLLERGMDVGSLGLSFVAVDPELDSLRDEPRFKALLKRLGLQG